MGTPDLTASWNMMSLIIDKRKIKYLFVIHEDRLFRLIDVRTRLTLKLLRNDIQIYTDKGEYSFENSSDRVRFQL